MTILVTGGAGFIGSNFVFEWLSHTDEKVVNLDALTYAGNVATLAPIIADPRHEFVRGDIRDQVLVESLLEKHRPRAIVHFAAESHVDRSINDPSEFIRTNVIGTFALLDAAKKYWQALGDSEGGEFRFLHISTDEVYGSLGHDDSPFVENDRYAPNSPYAASKAASDHIVRAWHQTYGFPAVTTSCSNNYGPYQFPEKLIPLIITNALRGKSLPVYGDGGNVRDWLFVKDHCAAIRATLERGRIGECYNIGGNSERTNIQVVEMVCDLLDELKCDPSGRYRRLITPVADRPGHDRRYAINCRKIMDEFGWRPEESFESGLRKTVVWYLSNEEWVENVSSGAYRDWIDRNCARRRTPTAKP